MAPAGPLLRLLPDANAPAPLGTRAFSLAAPGTLTEISGARAQGRTTLAATFVREAQAEGETAAWIMHDTAGPYAPDLLAAGLDPGALLAVRLPTTEGPHGLVRAAEILLRSNGFGLVVVELLGGVPRGLPAAWQGRLQGLARAHRARVVLLSSTPAEGDSLGPLITNRIEPSRRRTRDGYLLSLLPRRTKGSSGVALASTFHPAPDGL